MDTSVKDYGYGYIQDDKIYLKGFLGFADRKIGQVKLSEEASIKYFEDRFQMAKQKVLDLEQLIEEAQNKGSYLMKLIHMRKYLANFDGLGNYAELFAKLDEMETTLRELISVNRVKNLEIKSALLQETEEILKMDDLNEATELIKEVKQKWIKTGAVLEEKQEEVEEKFEYLYRLFFDRKKELTKQRSREARYKVNAYRDLIYKAENIKYSDDFDATFVTFRELQQRWKQVGKIPHKKALELWEKFKKANDFFFNRYKSFKAFKEKEPELSGFEIKSKYELMYCREAETLVDWDAHQEEFTERAKALLMDWKTLSNTFKELNNEIFERFRLACDKVFEISYLMRVVRRKYPDIDSKPKEDRLRIKISFMRELIRKDEMDLSMAESNYQKTAAQVEKQNAEVQTYQKPTQFSKYNQYNQQSKYPPRTPQPNFQLKEMQNTLNIQKRKINVKKQVLKELEDALSEIKKNFKY